MMPPSLPEEGEGEGGAAPHGPGIAAWMQPMPGGGWHGSLLHERGKGRGSRHAIELYRLFFINRPHRSAKSRQCLLVLGQGLRLAVLLARWPCPVAMPHSHADHQRRATSSMSCIPYVAWAGCATAA